MILFARFPKTASAELPLFSARFLKNIKNTIAVPSLSKASLKEFLIRTIMFTLQ